MMNIKDHDEEQEDMEISEKEDDTACNICCTLLWNNTYTKKEMWLVFNTSEIIRPCVVDLLLLVIFYPKTSMWYVLII